MNKPNAAQAKRIQTLAATAQERFWKKVNKTETCWIWTGTTSKNGYGYVTSNKGRWLVHRLAYTWANGPIPPGLEIDHLCRTRGCVRPDHLEAVTHAENVRRSESWSGVNSRKTTCLRGHALATLSFGRRCRECPNERRRARNKAA